MHEALGADTLAARPEGALTSRSDIVGPLRKNLESECDIEFFVAGGPGGQHRNKTASAVRLRHRPTGLVAVATERRSQHANRAVALERLRAKLAALRKKRKPRLPTRPTRASKERRLEAKRAAGRTKAGRATRRPGGDNDAAGA